MSMANQIEGHGFLFRENELVAPVRFRLEWGLDQAGHSHTEGELWVRPGKRLADYGRGPFRLHTGSGFSLAVEVTDAGEDWLAFRRLPQQSGSPDHALG